MRFFVICLALSLQVTARLHHSLIPEDPYAFPKYHVAFLNGLPVLNDTAHHWLRDGLQGGELEFLDEPWQSEHATQSTFKQIDGGDPTTEPHDRQPTYRLEHMKMGPEHSYLCFIPPESETHDTSFPSEEPSSPEVTLLQSWSLLQPLSGKCLYHRQGWFTYSYCHNSHVRQFREQPHAYPQPAGYKPEEDPEWEAYTLGQAPPGSDPDAGADLTVAEQNVLAVNLELARAAGTRYLVQRWGDGTVCDKTGRLREIEIQFHCSMTMTDTILFIKETTTCHYVLVIQTPRLCGDPVFRSRMEAREESTIRCREIIPSLDHIDHKTLIEASLPVHIQKANEAPSPKQESQPQVQAAQPPSALDKKLLSGILSQLREIGVGNVFSFTDGGLLLEDVGEDGTVLMTYEVELEAVEGIDGLTKGKQYDLTEAGVNALWSGESGNANAEDTERGDTEKDKEPGRPADEL